jgi:hypothetical protein
MSKLICHWCDKEITRADATQLCGKYVCNECYGNIFDEVYDDIGIECAKCEEERYLSEDWYCSACYEDAREVKCEGCGDFINPDDVKIFCEACLEEAIEEALSGEG